MKNNNITYNLNALTESERKWRSSPGLRLIYRDLFLKMRAAGGLGPALELGSGIGNFREVVPEVITSDVAATPYADRVVSAYEIQSSGTDWAVIYAFDVLHHLRDPMLFFSSAASALRQGGRIILMEPASTPFGRWIYRAIHHEPTRPDKIQEPYDFEPDDAEGHFANMGMGWALFIRDRGKLDKRFSAFGLACRQVSFHSGLAYLATGGYSNRQLLPCFILRLIMKLEDCLPQCIWSLIGLRMLIVIEKNTKAV
jgi:SAM-dependent methyltransferase